METTYQTCAPSATFVAPSPVGPSVRSMVTVAPVGVEGVDVVRARHAAFGIKAGAGNRAFGLAPRPRSVPV
jgi:hypothetical protein